MTLRLLAGGRSRGLKLGNLEVVIAPENEVPVAVEARAIEDDTHRVLGADPAYLGPTESVLRVMTAAYEAEPAPPGSVVVASGQPLRIHAIVHDLTRDPSWTEEWVSSVLRQVLMTVEQRRLRTLATPPLGVVHGTLGVDRFLTLLESAIDAVEPAHLRRIWLVASTIR